MPEAARDQAHALHRIGAALTRLLLWPVRVAAARQVLRQAAGLSEHELRDIGLSRQDVSDATALPLGSDPSRLFQARARERIDARSAGQGLPAPPTVPDLLSQSRTRPTMPARTPFRPTSASLSPR